MKGGGNERMASRCGLEGVMHDRVKNVDDVTIGSSFICDLF